jgi:transcription factor E2F7/8
MEDAAEHTQQTTWSAEERGAAPRRGSRAEKSLGLLSTKFMELYASSSAGESQISLDHAAASLGVERRRMYDVVGILEACEVVVRKGKNSYTCVACALFVASQRSWARG